MKKFIKSKLILQIGIACLVATFATAGIVGATTTIGANISTGGTLSVTDTSTLTGNVTAEGTLTVDGISTLTGATTIAGALTANGDVTLGDTIDDTVTVTGAFAQTYVADANSYVDPMLVAWTAGVDMLGGGAYVVHGKAYINYSIQNAGGARGALYFGGLGAAGTVNQARGVEAAVNLDDTYALTVTDDISAFGAYIGGTANVLPAGGADDSEMTMYKGVWDTVTNFNIATIGLYLNSKESSYLDDWIRIMNKGTSNNGLRIEQGTGATMTTGISMGSNTFGTITTGIDLGDTTTTGIVIGDATTGIILSGTQAYGIDMNSGTMSTADIRLSSGDTIKNATASSTVLSGLFVSDNASSTLANFGGGTTVAGLLFGTCTPSFGTVTASTTKTVLCGSTDLTDYNIFVTPYITDTEIIFSSASSTASGISVSVYNTGAITGDIATTDNAWSWMAIK